MLTGKNLEIFSTATIFLVLLASICVPQIPSVASDGEYTYYGVIPAKIYQYVDVDTSNLSRGYGLDNTSVRTKVLIAIIATEDDTNVIVYRVYSLNNVSLVSQTNMNAMEKYFVLFPNASMFKVVTDKYASVVLLNYPSIPSSGSNEEGPVPSTFQTSTDGAYVGKKFIFMASWNTRSYSWLSYRIFALEKAEVTITDENGNQEDYSLDVNTYKDIALTSFVSYSIESAGNIMIQSKLRQIPGDARYYYFVPSAEGGFLGNVFYTASTTSWDAEEDYGFRISAAQDTKVTIWNLQTSEKIMEFTVNGGEGIGVQPKADAILVQSIEPITLAYVHNGTLLRTLYPGRAYGSGVAYIGVRPDEETLIFLPTNATDEVYIFANERATVTIDGIQTVTIEADSYQLLTAAGTHKIVSDKNVVIEVTHWPLNPPYQGLNFAGVEVQCVQTVNVVPNVTLTLIGEGFPLAYIIIGVAVAIVAVGLVFFIMKRRAK
jgi:hypothetical protein